MKIIGARFWKNDLKFSGKQASLSFIKTDQQILVIKKVGWKNEPYVAIEIIDNDMRVISRYILRKHFTPC